MLRQIFVLLLLFITGLALPGRAALPDHPRILLLAGEEDRIKQSIQTDATWRKLHEAMLAECDQMINVKPVERQLTGRRLLDKSREALRRIFFLSYAWRLTGQEKYLKRGEQEMLAVAAFADWNPSHFLDVAEMTMAVAIGYDWLYAGLSPASRNILKEAILKKGIEPSNDKKYNSWLTATHNWNQVCNAGISYGALAIYEDQPALAEEVITRALETIILPMADYRPSGAYPEGYGYWGYGTSFNVMFISALEKAFGKDYGLTAKAGFLATAGYLEHMTGPSGNPFNYGDAGSGGSLQPAMFWFAQKIKDPSLLWVERNRLMHTDAKRHMRDRLLPAIMVWHNGVGMNQITAPKTRLWTGGGKSPVALMRSSWTDPKGIYLGLKAGSPSVNHGHMDVGSFIMEAQGVRWAMDFGMQDYNSLETKGVALWGREQNAQRWQVFRYNNFVHNTLTLNRELQRVEGYATITSSGAAPAFMFATTDLSTLYKGLVGQAKRGVAIAHQQYVVIRDELAGAPAPTTVRWTMLTPATVKVTGKNTAVLTKDGQKLTLLVAEPAQLTMKTWTTTPTHDYDAPNPGTTLVGFEVKLPANSKTALTVLLLPAGTEKKANRKVPALAKWGAVVK